ncbi:hypothetical protein ACFXPI_10975 [Streptomyces sp. NPDC059104]|uniref:hypothetical protein n=1 Tax=Streptomyces sp. NPDC059104 TaxID=3346729 RepID=UPI0036826ED2
MTNTMIAALLREREAYERRGQDERVAQVDEQLAHYGYERADEQQAPGGRSAPPQENADGDGAKERRGRGRPKLPRDAEGNVIRE